LLREFKFAVHDSSEFANVVSTAGTSIEICESQKRIFKRLNSIVWEERYNENQVENKKLKFETGKSRDVLDNSIKEYGFVNFKEHNDEFGDKKEVYNFGNSEQKKKIINPLKIGNGKVPILSIGKDGNCCGKKFGEFNNPMSVCVNSEGNIIIADCNNHKIQVFDEHGVFVKQIESSGYVKEFVFVKQIESSGYVKEFMLPQGICVDDSDNIYMTENSSNNRIHVFGLKTKNGYLGGICIDRINKNNIIVSDYKNHRICIHNNKGEFIREFGSFGVGAGKLNKPIGMCVDSQNRIIVSECGNHRVQVFDQVGNHIKFIGEKDNLLIEPRQICIDPNDNLYVGNWSDKRHPIQVFNTVSGKFVHSINIHDKSDPDRSYPVGVAIHKKLNALIVVDNYRHAVLAFDSD